MTNSPILAIAFLGVMLAVPAGYSQDLSRYRDFPFGMGLPALAQQIQMKTTDARVIHQRPALIQELEWQTYSLDSALQSDSVKSILFGFYNGELYRIVVTYDRDHTNGLTAEDLVVAVSAMYGKAGRPVAKLTFSSMQLYDGEKAYLEESEKVLARWEDGQYSVNLYESSFEISFGLVMYSKRLEGLAQAAALEAKRLDKQELPGREKARQKKEAEDSRVQQEKARRLNKAPFRP
jgi:hypothetical protein